MAHAQAKLGVAVDLRYQFEGAVAANQPVTLHLAAIPRVAGTNLKVSVKKVRVSSSRPGAVHAQGRAPRASIASSCRSSARAAAPATIRVLVTMDVPEGAGFGFFSIPLDGGTNPQKSDSVKQP